MDDKRKCNNLMPWLENISTKIGERYPKSVGYLQAGQPLRLRILDENLYLYPHGATAQDRKRIDDDRSNDRKTIKTYNEELNEERTGVINHSISHLSPASKLMVKGHRDYYTLACPQGQYVLQSPHDLMRIIKETHGVAQQGPMSEDAKRD